MDAITASPWSCYELAKASGCRLPELESKILESHWASFFYARDVISGRWLEAESSIMRIPILASKYAREVLQARWTEGEDSIKKDPWGAFLYESEI